MSLAAGVPQSPRLAEGVGDPTAQRLSGPGPGVSLGPMRGCVQFLFHAGLCCCPRTPVKTGFPPLTEVTSPHGPRLPCFLQLGRSRQHALGVMRFPPLYLERVFFFLNADILNITVCHLLKESESISWSVVSDSLRPHGILQARALEWVAMPSSRGCSPPRDRTWVSHIAGSFFAV